jgi:hypothetical protein
MAIQVSTAKAKQQATLTPRRPVDYGKLLLLIFLYSAVPILVQLFGRGDLQRANKAEADELGIRMVPDALG